MSTLPMLRFSPIVKELVWGGRKLETVLSKPLPKSAPFGESWEVVDLADNQSRVANGPFEGQTLEALLKKHRKEILGDAALLDGRFPLLFKYIDACQTLSVQVHPDAVACERIGDGARPKTEAWYIIDREPGSKIYVGLKPGVDKAALKSAIEAGRVADLLYEMSVEPGDYVFLPAGTIHAIGEGILLAEVQQSSDTTYRVFDWNRVGLDGKPRTLHIDEAVEATDFAAIQAPVAPSPASGRTGVVSEFFEMETVHLQSTSLTLSGKGPLVLMGVNGKGTAHIRSGKETAHLRTGETILIPAAISNTVSLSSTHTISLLSVRIP